MSGVASLSKFFVAPRVVWKKPLGSKRTASLSRTDFPHDKDCGFRGACVCIGFDACARRPTQVAVVSAIGSEALTWLLGKTPRCSCRFLQQFRAPSLKPRPARWYLYLRDQGDTLTTVPPRGAHKGALLRGALCSPVAGYTHTCSFDWIFLAPLSILTLGASWFPPCRQHRHFAFPTAGASHYERPLNFVGTEPVRQHGNPETK